MKTGFIAIIGRPNVGKSTLLNALLGEKVAIVSNKPQTTRTRITGILTKGENQYVFLDTPGIHTPHNKLGQYMAKAISTTIADVDSAILVVEAGHKPGDVELSAIQRVKDRKLPCLLVINKIDAVNGEQVGQTIEFYKDLYDFSSIIPISALKNKGVDIVLDECGQFMKDGEWHFDEDELTDQPERQIAAEIIREKILRTMNDEIPHGIAVTIEQFDESPKLLSIYATIYCERESHKRIIIGKQGAMLKRIGSYAREDMEAFFGIKVYLNLWVKVKENWRENEMTMHNLGFNQKDLT